MSFYDSIAEYYEYIFPVGRSKADFILESLDKRIGNKVLDIGCATGGLAALLSLENHVTRIEAIDLDGGMIRLAASEHQSEKINFRVLDMTVINDVYNTGSFDAVSCLGNTLVHLDGPEEILDFLKSIRMVLRRGGMLLLQILNYRYIIDNSIQKLPLIDNDMVRFVRTYLKMGDRLSFNTELTIKPLGKTIENSIPLYPIVKNELVSMLKETGFHSIESFASFAMEPYTGNHLPLVMRAR